MVKAILQTLLTEVEQVLNGCALTAEVIVSDLPSLQVREKWRRALPNLKLNALVLLVDENASRNR